MYIFIYNFIHIYYSDNNNLIIVKFNLFECSGNCLVHCRWSTNINFLHRIDINIRSDVGQIKSA